MYLPDWLRVSDPYRGGLQADDYVQKKALFLERTLTHTVSFTKDVVFNKEVSEKRGFLQGVEPRVKIAGSIFFIILISLQKSPAVIGVFFSLCLLLAVLSRIPLKMFLKRLMPVFLITTLVALPSILNLIVEGNTVTTIFELKRPYKIGTFVIPEKITITKEGILTAVTLMLRAVTSTAMVFLQTMTTPFERLIKGVSSFLPGSLRSIFSISYRYIFFLIKRVEEFIAGYRARNISGSLRDGRAWVSSTISALFSISLRLSKDLEKAMQSRGYYEGL